MMDALFTALHSPGITFLAVFGRKMNDSRFVFDPFITPTFVNIKEKIIKLSY